jgi:eukaryotic-like serine/threonine-protein kinase
MIWRIIAILLLVLLALAAPPAIRYVRERPPAPPPAVRLALEPPPGTEFGGGALPFDLAVSPTGEEIAFVATTAGESQLWRRRLDAHRAEPIPGTTGATLPAYAADGSALWYFAGAKLHALNLATGERREPIDAPAPGGVAIGRDGTILYAAGGPIQRVADGRTTPATTLRPGERSHALPAWAEAEEDVFVYLATAADGRRTIRLVDGDEDIELTRADSHAILSAGHLVFVRGGMLRAEPLDLEARRLGPRAVTLALQVDVSGQGRGAFAAGGHVLASAPPIQQQYVLRWFADTGAALATISEPGDYWQLRLSPDDRTAAVTVRDPLLRTLDVFTVPAEGGAPARLTLALAADSDPVWSHDARRIAFRSAQSGQPHIYARDIASRRNTDALLWQSPLDEVPTDWPRAFLLFHARSPQSGFDIWALPPSGSAPRHLARSGFNEVDGRLSPDGRWLAYASDEAGQYDVYVSLVSDPSRRTRISTAGGTRPQWTRGGRAVVFLRGPDVHRAMLSFDAAGVRASTPERVLSVPRLRDAAAARDGARYLVIAPINGVQERNIDVVAGWRALLHSG